MVMVAPKNWLEHTQRRIVLLQLESSIQQQMEQQCMQIVLAPAAVMQNLEWQVGVARRSINHVCSKLKVSIVIMYTSGPLLVNKGWNSGGPKFSKLQGHYIVVSRVGKNWGFNKKGQRGGWPLSPLFLIRRKLSTTFNSYVCSSCFFLDLLWLFWWLLA